MVPRLSPPDTGPRPAAPFLPGRRFDPVRWRSEPVFRDFVTERPLTPAFKNAVEAIGKGDHDALARLLDAEPGLVHEHNNPEMRATLLHYTAFNGVPELAHNAPKETPRLARLLLERGAEPDAVAFDRGANTPLSWALSSWLTHAPGIQNALADAYLDGGARIEGPGNDGSPLGHAVGFGYTSAVEHLARRGARVDHLMAAAALGDLERIQRWHLGGGRFAPEAMDFHRGDREETGRFSWPPPANPDPGAFALITAATHGSEEVVEYLLDEGVDANGTVTRNQTALHFAAYIGHPTVVAILLLHGARLDIRETQFQRLPHEWARETGEDGIAARLVP